MDPYQKSLVRAFDYQLKLPKLHKTQTHPTFVRNNAVKSVLAYFMHQRFYALFVEREMRPIFQWLRSNTGMMEGLKILGDEYLFGGDKISPWLR